MGRQEHWIRPPVSWSGGSHLLDGEGQVVHWVGLFILSNPNRALVDSDLSDLKASVKVSAS